MNKSETCDTCGAAYSIGDWPLCPHGAVYETKGFEPYFDYGLGIHVTTPGDRNKAMRPRWEDDHIVHLQARERPAIYYKEMNERREERARRGR